MAVDVWTPADTDIPPPPGYQRQASGHPPPSGDFQVWTPEDTDIPPPPGYEPEPSAPEWGANIGRGVQGAALTVSEGVLRGITEGTRWAEESLNPQVAPSVQGPALSVLEGMAGGVSYGLSAAEVFKQQQEEKRRLKQQAEARQGQPREVWYAENMLREHKQKYGNEVPSDKSYLFKQASKTYEDWLKKNPKAADKEFDEWRRSGPVRDYMHTAEKAIREARGGKPPEIYENLSEAMVGRHAYRGSGEEWLPWVVKRTGFSGRVFETAEYLAGRRAVKNILEGNATQRDWMDLASATDLAELNKNKGKARKFLDLASSLPGFMLEFGVTGAAFSGTRLFTAKGAYGGVSRAMRNPTIKALSETLPGRLAVWGITKAAPATAGTITQTALDAPFVASRIADKWKIPYELTRNDAGELTIMMTDDGIPSLWEATWKGAGSAVTEFGTERTGDFPLWFAKWVGKTKAGQSLMKMSPIQRGLGLKAALMRRFFAKGGTLAEARKILRMGGYNNLFGEVFEERLGDLTGGMTGIEDDYGLLGRLATSDPGAWEDFFIEAASFAAMPGGVTALAAAQSALGPTESRDAERIQSLRGKLAAGATVSRPDAMAILRETGIDLTGLKKAKRTQIVKDIFEELGIQEKEDAGENREAAAVHGNVLDTQGEEEGAGQVPAEEGGGGIQTEAEGGVQEVTPPLVDPEAKTEDIAARVKSRKRKLLLALLDADETDEGVDEAFKTAGWTRHPDGFWLDPEVDPEFVDQLSPETFSLLKQHGIRFIQYTPRTFAAGQKGQIQHGKMLIKGVNLATEPGMAKLFTRKDHDVQHEIGHHVWDTLTEDQKKSWSEGPRVTEHGQSIAEQRGYRAETYDASEAAEEDFADAFAEEHGNVDAVFSRQQTSGEAVEGAGDTPPSEEIPPQQPTGEEEVVPEPTPQPPTEKLPPQEPTAAPQTAPEAEAEDLSKVGEAGGAIVDNFYKGILKSLNETGDVPSAERNSGIGRAWQRMQDHVTPEKFVEDLQRLQDPELLQPPEEKPKEEGKVKPAVRYTFQQSAGMREWAPPDMQHPDTFLSEDGSEPETGKQFSATVFRGKGRESVGEIYAEGAEGPSLGKGTYWAPTQEVAKRYGPDVQEAVVSLSNPFVLSNDEQLSQLAGGYIGHENAKRVAKLKAARAELEKRGHDGVVVLLPFGDMDANDKSNKRLREIFAHPQVISFSESAQKPAETQEPPKPKEEQKPQAPIEEAAPTRAPTAKDVLRKLGLKVTKSPEGWEVTGNTFKWKADLKALGGRFNGDKAWTFRNDPTGSIVARLGDRADEEGQGDGGGSDAQMERNRLREAEAARPDERGTREDYLEFVGDDTRGLISRGAEHGIPAEVLDGQIEDIGKATRAYANKRPMFLIGSAPGMGKSFVLGGVIRELRKRGAKKFVYVTENQELIRQLRKDLNDYGLQNVKFVTYAGIRKALPDASGAVLLLDEAHNAKNLSTQNGKAVQKLSGTADFTVFATATPFENVSEAKYLEASGIFDGIEGQAWRKTDRGRQKVRISGFDAWAYMHGANIFWPKKAARPVLYWHKHMTAEEGQIAANEWLARRGVYTQRPMILPKGMVSSVLRPVQVEGTWSDTFEKALVAYQAAEADAENQMEAGMVRAHGINLQKRILEASKVKEGIDRAKALIAEGKQVIIFVNTKADRVVGRYMLSEPYRKHHKIKGAAAKVLYTPEQIANMMEEHRREKELARRMHDTVGPAPFAKSVFLVSQAMGRLGIDFELPSVADELLDAFPKGQAVEYTGRLSDAKAKENLDKWKKNEAKVIVATMDKGGTGLSYHDTTGTMPERAQVNINLPWSGTQVAQVSGRLARLGTAKKVYLEWIFADNIPFERELSKTVGSRMRSMQAAVQGMKGEMAQQIKDFEFENAPSTEVAAKPKKEAKLQKQRKEAHEARYWKDLKRRAPKGEKGTVKIALSEGKNKIDAEAFILDDTWAITRGVAEVNGKLVPIDKKTMTKEQYKLSKGQEWMLTHIPTGMTMASASQNNLRQLYQMIKDSGVTVPKTAKKIKDDTELIKTMRAIESAWDNNDLSRLPDELRQQFLDAVKQADAGITADRILDSADLQGSKAIPLLKKLASEVPEFAYDPVFIVDENKKLVFRDHYTYRFEPSVFNLDEKELTPGESVGFNLPDLGIKRITDQATVIRKVLNNEGYRVSQGEKRKREIIDRIHWDQEKTKAAVLERVEAKGKPAAEEAPAAEAPVRSMQAAVQGMKGEMAQQIKDFEFENAPSTEVAAKPKKQTAKEGPPPKEQQRIRSEMPKDLKAAFVSVGQKSVKVTELPDNAGWQVKLANGRTAKFLSVPGIKVDIRAAAQARGVSEDVIQKMLDAGAAVAGVTAAPGAVVVLSDGTIVTANEVMSLIDPAIADKTTARHEALHIAKELGLFDTTEGKRLWKSLIKEYGNEEGIAEAREAWSEPEGLWAKIRDFFRRIWSAIGFDFHPDVAMAETFKERFWGQETEKAGISSEVARSISGSGSVAGKYQTTSPHTQNQLGQTEFVPHPVTSIRKISPQTKIGDLSYQIISQKWAAFDQERPEAGSVNNRLRRELDIHESLFGEFAPGKDLPGRVVKGKRELERSAFVEQLFKDIYQRVKRGDYAELLDRSITPTQLARKRRVPKKWRKRFIKNVSMLRQGPLYLAPSQEANILPILSNNAKAGHSTDFLIATCHPSANCVDCYAAGTMVRQNVITKAYRSTVLILADPKAWGKQVASEAATIPRSEMPFIRMLGSGDLTTTEMVRGFNELAKRADRPIHIFSRHHDMLAKLKDGKNAPFLRLGSVDPQLYKTYGLKFLKENFDKRKIANCWMMGTASEIPAMRRLMKADALKLILVTDAKLFNALDEDMKISACPCDAGENTFVRSCSECALAQTGCFMAFSEWSIDSKGKWWKIDDPKRPADTTFITSWFPGGKGSAAEAHQYNAEQIISAGITQLKTRILSYAKSLVGEKRYDAMRVADKVERSENKALLGKSMIKAIQAKERTLGKSQTSSLALFDVRWPGDRTRVKTIREGLQYLGLLERIHEQAKKGSFYLPGGEIRPPVAYEKGEPVVKPTRRKQIEKMARKGDVSYQIKYPHESSTAGKTAIGRNKPSTPAQYLIDNELIKGRVLDYGSGRGADAKATGADMYDPTYAPEEPEGKYDTIYSNFVLNVIESPQERQEVLENIGELLAPNGVAYISVRNDKKALKGVTSKGTWQGFIELALPVEKSTRGYVMYRATKKDLSNLGKRKVDVTKERRAAAGPATMRIGDIDVEPSAITSEMASSTEGKALIKRLTKDAAKPRKWNVGRRSIFEFIAKQLHARMIVARSQVSKRHPGLYRETPHVWFAKSGLDAPTNLHEAGHALLGFLQDSGDLSEELQAELTAFADIHQRPDGYASAVDPHEGMAELLRIWTTDPTSIPETLRSQFESVVEARIPGTLDALKDARLAFLYNEARPETQVFIANINDHVKRGERPPINQGSAYWHAFAYEVVGPSAAWTWLEKEIWRNMIGLQGTKAKLETLVSKQGRKARRDANAVVREIMKSLEDTPADLKTAQQLTFHVPSIVSNALYQTKEGVKGLRVTQFGDGFYDLPKAKKAIERLRAAGFFIPKKSKHGEWLRLFDNTLYDSKEALGDMWEPFLAWGQYRTVLHRIRYAAAKGETYRYPEMDRYSPEFLAEWVPKMARAHPTWDQHYKQLQALQDQALLLDVLSGEHTVDEVIRMKEAHEDFWTLPRRVENVEGPQGGGRGAHPTSGVRRQYGSQLPFIFAQDSIERKVYRHVQAYYNIAAKRSLLRLQEQMRSHKDWKTLPFAGRKFVESIMVPLRMDVGVAVTLNEEELRQMAADAINAYHEREAGDTLPDELIVEPGDVVLDEENKPIFRPKRPNMANVISLFDPKRPGKRQYFYIPDRLIFMLQAQRGSDILDWAFPYFKIGREITEPFKRELVQNLAFALRNINRDITTGVGLGKYWQELIPGYTHAVGLVTDTLGKDAGERMAAELISHSIEGVHHEHHKGVWGGFMAAMQEGIVIPGRDDMTTPQKLARLPGQISSAICKPATFLNYWSTGRYWSNKSEVSGRAGSYYAAKAAGASSARAQLAFDESKGNFTQHSRSRSTAEMWRMMGFLNPAWQISWQMYDQAFHPDPQVRTMWYAVKAPIIAVKAMTMAAATVLGTMAIISAFSPGDDDERKKRLKEWKQKERNRSIWSRVRYMHIGPFKLPFEYGPLGALESAAYVATMDMFLEGKVGVDKLKEIAMARIPSAREFFIGNLLPVPMQVKTGVELIMDYRFFFDKPVVGERLKEKFPQSPELRTWPDTPELYKTAGRAIGVSPEQIRHAVRGTMTSLGDDLISFLSRGIAGEPLFGAEAAEWPLIGRLMSREARGFASQPVQDLDALVKEQTGLLNKIKDAKRRGVDTAQLEEQVKQLELARVMNTLVEDAWEASKKERQSRNPDQELAMEHERQMTDLAARFFELAEGKTADPELRDRLHLSIITAASRIGTPQRKDEESDEDFAERVEDYNTRRQRLFAADAMLDRPWKRPKSHAAATESERAEWKILRNAVHTAISKPEDQDEWTVEWGRNSGQFQLLKAMGVSKTDAIQLLKDYYRYQKTNKTTGAPLGSASLVDDKRQERVRALYQLYGE